MKRGDIVRKNFLIEEGVEIALNFNSREQAENWIRSELEKHYKFDESPIVEAVPSEGGKWSLITRMPFKHYIEMRVNWVVEDECGVTELSGSAGAVMNVRDLELVSESEVSFQSIVDGMTDEQLRESLEELRGRRTQAKMKVRRVAVVGDKEDNDPIMKQLNSLPPDVREELRKKLGL